MLYLHSPPTIQSSYVAIAMYLTSYVMLLRRPAIAPAEWVGGELRWYVACVCDPELLSTANRFVNKKTNGSTQREASGATQVRSTNEQNQTDRIRHR